MAQKFNNDKYDLDNGKLKEFAQHNPTIIGEPRAPDVGDIDRRLGGLPKILECAYLYVQSGHDSRTKEQQDIPLLMICSMARASGFFEAYCTMVNTAAIDALTTAFRGGRL